MYKSAQAIEMRRLLRAGFPSFAVGEPGLRQVYRSEDLLAALRAKLARTGDYGFASLLARSLLENRNPFDPQRTPRPRRAVVAVGALVASLLAAMWWFNAAALERSL